MKVLFLSLISIFALINAQEEASYINANEEGFVNSEGTQDPSHQVEFDGLVLKINEVVFESIMKKINFAIIFFYEDNCSECDQVLSELKFAAESIVRLVPPVGVFKMKCSENKKICQDVKKDKIPFIIWINNDNFGYLTETDRYSFIKSAEKMAITSKIKTIETEEEFNEFISSRNYFRILALFPQNKTIENADTKLHFHNVHLIEQYLEKAVPESFLLKSGEFTIGKIVDYNLIKLVNLVNLTRTAIVIYYKDEIVDFPSLMGLSSNQIYGIAEKYSFVNQYINERTYTYYISNNGTRYQDKDFFITEIVYNSLPFIFPLNNKIYNLVFSGPIRKQFLYILSPNHSTEENLKRLQEYNNYSQKFRIKGYYIWFGFVIYEKQIKEMFRSELEELNKKEETDLPLLIMFDFKKKGEEARRGDVEKKLFTKELNFNNLEEFFLSVNSNQTTNKTDSNQIMISEDPEDIDYDSFKNYSDLPKVVGQNFQELVMDFPDNVLVLMQDSDQYKHNLYNKWIFLLNKIRKIVNSKVLRVYKFNVEKNDIVSTKLPSKYPTLKMFMRHGKTIPIDYNQGIKIETLSQFLNHLLPTLEIKFSPEEIKLFEAEINSNPNYSYNKKETDEIDLDEKDNTSNNEDYSKNDNTQIKDERKTDL